MNRRQFCEKASCGMAALAISPGDGGVGALHGIPRGPEAGGVQERRRYVFAIEIFEGRERPCGAGHRLGDRFEYPADKGKICPWLMDSMDGFLRVLEHGGTLSWTYRGTPYEKELDPDGVTTEFVRCPDPTTSGVVAKITRTRVR